MSSNSTQTDTPIRPWYKQFWLWFLVFFPALSVVAGVITIIIAVKNDDSLVRDDYYKAGLAINSRLALDKQALQQNISATLNFDPVIGELQLQLRGDFKEAPKELNLDFIHLTHQPKDFNLTLKLSRNMRYVGQLKQSIHHRWYLQLNDTAPVSWRLKTLSDFKNTGTANTHSDPAPHIIEFKP